MVRFWEDFWIGDGALRSLIAGHLSREQNDIKISDVWDMNLGWNLDSLGLILPRETVAAIRATTHGLQPPILILSLGDPLQMVILILKMLLPCYSIINTPLPINLGLPCGKLIPCLGLLCFYAFMIGLLVRTCFLKEKLLPLTSVS